MCTVTIDIDEKTLRDVNPNLSDKAAIREWAQQLIDKPYSGDGCGGR